MKIAIYGSRNQEPYKDNIAAFLDILGAAGAEIVMHRNLYNTLVQIMPEALGSVRRVVDDQEFDADVAVSFGGDGTFLRTAMWVGDKSLPIFGVNTGHLGYLTGAGIDELPAVAAEILGGDYVTEERSLIHLVSPQLSTWPYALNEVVVAKYDTSSMITADTAINGAPLASYRADGLIVATPTGSTAYNLSVGGPIIEPSAPVWVVSPISAHSLSMRPLVVSDSAELSITVDSRATGFRLSIDGRSGTLPVGAEIVLRKAPFTVRPVVRPGHEFPEPLRRKLFWGRENF